MIAVAQFAALCCLSMAYLTGAEKLPQHHGSHHAPGSHHALPTYYIPPQPSYTPPRVTHSHAEPSYSSTANNMPMPFGYGYGITDQNRGIDFGHNTNSDGKVTTGEYRVLLPDGRTQIVSYTVDDYNGYQADVSYDGEAHPHKDSHTYGEPQISYSQPKPVSEPIQQSYGQPKSSYDVPPHQPLTTYNLPEATYIEPKSPKPLDTLYRSQF